MDSFGATLRKEREERGMTLDTVAAVIGIDRGSLAALERNEFDGLPDPETMVAGLRAYADCLQVDADLMIEHYEHERERCLQRLADFVAERAAEVTAVEPQATPVYAQRRRRQSIVSPAFVPLVAIALLALVGVWWAFRGDATTHPTLPLSSITKATAPPSEPSAAPPPSTKATPTEPTRTRATPPMVGMTISDHGIGTGVRDRQLVGRNDRFPAGTQAWFWTHVEGGARGDRIEHIWMHEGVEAARIGLNIGGSRWRTQSSKTLRSTGAWTVEARDTDGRVLARTEFDCVP